jgi:hypothetical protein
VFLLGFRVVGLFRSWCGVLPQAVRRRLGPLSSPLVGGDSSFAPPVVFCSPFLFFLLAFGVWLGPLRGTGSSSLLPALLVLFLAFLLAYVLTFTFLARLLKAFGCDQMPRYAEHRSCWVQLRLPQTVLGCGSTGFGLVSHGSSIKGPGVSQVQGLIRQLLWLRPNAAVR